MLRSTHKNNCIHRKTKKRRTQHSTHGGLAPPNSFNKLICRLEHIFAYTTNWADPVVGNIFECSAWLDTTIWISFFRIVDISTRCTDVFLCQIRSPDFGDFVLSYYCLGIMSESLISRFRKALGSICVHGSRRDIVRVVHHLRGSNRILDTSTEWVSFS